MTSKRKQGQVEKAKFMITPDRVAEVCDIVEYMNLYMKDRGTVINVASRFVVDAGGEYIMKFTHDEDGNIETSAGYGEALTAMQAGKVTPKRLEKLIDEFSEAARGVVNPPKDGG